MSWLSDDAISRLQAVAALPDLSGTRYRILKRIGCGGMGSVYLAEDAVLARRVALKVLDVPGANSELAGRLLREAKILAQLEHPAIVPVHDAGTLADGRVYYAMKFVQGQRLDCHVTDVPSLVERLRIFEKICEAVAFAHARNVLHRDLKPENIMVGQFGEVLVMDWGIGKFLARDEETRKASQTAPATARSEIPRTAHGVPLGTPGYMAPEQARGETERLDARADIYSLGALLRFLARNGASHAMPPQVSAIAQKAMASNPWQRYTSVAELARDVSRYAGGLPVSAYPENVFRKLARWVGRYRVAIILVLTYLVVRAVLLLWFRR